MGKRHILAVVLAGGAARRMGGGDKPLRLLGGRPLLSHVLERVAPQVGAVVLNVNGDPRRFASFGLTVAADDAFDDGKVEALPGPLAGVLAGLDYAAQCNRENKERASSYRHVLSVPGDAPFLPRDLAERLEAAAENDATIAVASSGQTHPVVALWPVGLAASLRHALRDEGVRKITHFTDRYEVRLVSWPLGDDGGAGAQLDPFTNINTAADLILAEEQWARLSGDAAS